MSEIPLRDAGLQCLHQHLEEGEGRDYYRSSHSTGLGHLWRQGHQQGFIPKVATIAKAILFPAAVGALGGDFQIY